MDVQRFAVLVSQCAVVISILYSWRQFPARKHWLCLKGSTNKSEILIQRATTHDLQRFDAWRLFRHLYVCLAGNNAQFLSDLLI